MIVSIKEYPKLKAIMRKAAPDYRKHKVIITESTSVEPSNGYWDGGSRSYYAVFTIGGQPVGAVPTPTAPPQFGGGQPVPFAIDSEHMVIVFGTFRGKTAAAHIYINDKTRLLG